MSFTRRRKITVSLTGALVLIGGGVGALALAGRAPAVVQRAFNAVTGHQDPPPPPTCPLTGQLAPRGTIPDRPVLAVKVENLAEARPQSGLDRADVIYEEPVEGGITRFIVLFQCEDAPRVGPVRSGRTTDPDVLVQYGKPLIGYAGGADKVEKAISKAGLVDVNFITAADAYWRDPARSAPHDLYASTKKLRTAGRSKADAPDPVFAYTDDLTVKSKRARQVHLPFSNSSDVYWRWNAKQGAWLRSHGSEAHVLDSGEQVSATNVVVQVVEVGTGDIVDAAGNPSPTVTLTGGGKAYVFRDGRMIVGRWQRDSLGEVTRFLTRSGVEIPLTPGTTWVELFPSTLSVDVG